MSTLSVALIAADQDDADRYQSIYPDIADAKVFFVAQYRRMEGARVSAVHATPRARMHRDYSMAYLIMRLNYVLCNDKAPRVL